MSKENEFPRGRKPQQRKEGRKKIRQEVQEEARPEPQQTPEEGGLDALVLPKDVEAVDQLIIGKGERKMTEPTVAGRLRCPFCGEDMISISSVEVFDIVDPNGFGVKTKVTLGVGTSVTRDVRKRVEKTITVSCRCHHCEQRPQLHIIYPAEGPATMTWRKNDGNQED